jgi:hypothetical protein
MQKHEFVGTRELIQKRTAGLGTFIGCGCRARLP